MWWCATTSIRTHPAPRGRCWCTGRSTVPRLERVAQFGDPVGPGTLDGFISDSGLRPRYPAVEIYRVVPAGPVADNPGAPTCRPSPT